MVRSRLFKIASHQITPLTGRSLPFWRRAAPSPCRPQKQTSSLSGLGRHWDVPHRSSPAPSPGSSRPGERNGIPATGRKGELRGVTIWRIQGGRITEEWSEFDRTDMLQQLGLMGSSK